MHSLSCAIENRLFGRWRTVIVNECGSINRSVRVVEIVVQAYDGNSRATQSDQKYQFVALHIFVFRLSSNEYQGTASTFYAQNSCPPPPNRIICFMFDQWWSSLGRDENWIKIDNRQIDVDLFYQISSFRPIQFDCDTGSVLLSLPHRNRAAYVGILMNVAQIFLILSYLVSAQWNEIISWIHVAFGFDRLRIVFVAIDFSCFFAVVVVVIRSFLYIIFIAHSTQSFRSWRSSDGSQIKFIQQKRDEKSENKWKQKKKLCTVGADQKIA